MSEILIFGDDCQPVEVGLEGELEVNSTIRKFRITADDSCSTCARKACA